MLSLQPMNVLVGNQLSVELSVLFCYSLFLLCARQSEFCYRHSCCRRNRKLLIKTAFGTGRMFFFFSWICCYCFLSFPDQEHTWFPRHAVCSACSLHCSSDPFLVSGPTLSQALLLGLTQWSHTWLGRWISDNWISCHRWKDQILTIFNLWFMRCAILSNLPTFQAGIGLWPRKSLLYPCPKIVLRRRKCSRMWWLTL